MKIIWLCHSIKKPVGGVKVIYRQAELVNKILQPLGHRAVGKPSMSRISGAFNLQEDMVVLPELWARKYGDQLAKIGIPYAIYVQNGYYITKGARDVLDTAYRKARCILTISDDASRCVTMAFPGVEQQILRVHYGIDVDRFNPHQSKENLITYMPRKLADHSSKVLFFLHSHLPPNWEIRAIDGLNEAGVAALLQRSKIFLSFSHFEGCPLPPLEAALSGNQVIGYTGQGAKEYWRPEIFETVEAGDVVGFAQAVLQKIKQLDATPQFPVHLDVIQSLAERYGAKSEEADMHAFTRKMGLCT